MVPRLNVLRGVLTEITVLQKRSEAVKTDKQLYKLLSKRQKACKSAAEEFQTAGREDLVGKEHEQIGVLQGYMAEFPTLSTDETVVAIKSLIRWMQGKGSNPKNERKALKRLFQEGGAFHNKIVDEGFVAETFQRLISELPPWDPSLKEERTDDGNPPSA